uniref:Uncharacterized protein n=1 Tax=Anguilla anguilla TaxID=7936 RepID=A0A0E9Y1A0_ANGAN
MEFNTEKMKRHLDFNYLKQVCTNIQYRTNLFDQL